MTKKYRIPSSNNNNNNNKNGRSGGAVKEYVVWNLGWNE